MTINLFKAKLGICGPLFLYAYSVPFMSSGAKILDGFMLLPSEKEGYKHLYVRSEGIPPFPDVDLTKLFAIHAYEVATTWIASNKGKLAEFLTSNLEFSEVSQQERVYLSSHQKFDILKNVKHADVSEVTWLMINELLAQPKLIIG